MAVSTAPAVDLNSACISVHGRRPANTVRRLVATLAGAAVLTTASCRSSPEDLEATPTTAGPDRSAEAVDTISQVDFDNWAYPLGESADGRLANDGVLEWTDDYGRYSGSVGDPLFEDLDGDGVDEAAVLVTWDFLDGTGRFSDVFVFRLDDHGRVEIVTSAGAGDRAEGGIRSVVRDKGVLVLERLGGDDGACCPTWIERQALYLSGGELVADGPASRRAYIIMHEGNDAPSELKFLPGTVQAEIDGDASKPTSLVFKAAAGQKMTLDLTGSPADGSARLSVKRAGTEILAVRAGTSTSETLSDGGEYHLVFGRAGNGPSTYNALITIR